MEERGSVKKRILWIAVALVVGGLVVGLNLHRARGKATEVEVRQLARMELVARVSASGRIEARRSVSTTASVVGKVVEKAVEEGDFVEKGQLILRVDPRERQAFVDQAHAGLSRARANLELSAARLRESEFEYKRVKGLVRADLASEQTLESARTNHDVQVAAVAAAREDVRNAEAQLRQTEHELEKTVVRAEIAGVVVRLSVEEGENVLAGDLYNQGSAIVVVADLTEMEAQVLVDETEVVEIHPGQPATIEVDAFPDLELTGKVIEVGNSAYNAGPLGTQESMDFRVRVLLDDLSSRLRPGLSATAKIETARVVDALAVPMEALTIRIPSKERDAESKNHPRKTAPSSGQEEMGPEEAERLKEEAEGVFLCSGDRVSFIAVERGIAGEKHFEVLSGVQEGATVVTGPFEALRKLESGQPVRYEEPGEKPGGDDERQPADDAAEGKSSMSVKVG
jgi:HlyD family secretion protein